MKPLGWIGRYLEEFVRRGQLRVESPQNLVSIGLLNVIEKEASIWLTPVAPLGGFVETTVGFVWQYA